MPDLIAAAPVHDYDAEKILLASLLWRPDTWAKVPMTLTGADFYDRMHGNVFDLARSMRDDDKPTDAMAVALEIRRLHHEDECGDGAYLSELVGSCDVTASNVDHWAAVVRNLSVLRQIRYAADDLFTASCDTGADAVDVLETVERRLFRLSQTAVAESAYDLPKSAEVLLAQADRESDETGLRTGIDDLDRVLGGLRQGQVIVLAARTSMGKSALAAQIAAHACFDKGLPVTLFSFEMTHAAMLARVAASRTGIDARALVDGARLSDADQARLSRWLLDQQGKPWRVIEASGMTIQRIRSRCRREVTQRGCRLVVVDYVGLIDTSDVARHGQSREREVAAISAGLKALAVELQIPVIAVVQINRAPESRKEHRPLMSDLRESGAIEQDADVVLLLYREGYYSKNANDRSAEVDVAKNRNGPTGRVRLEWDGPHQRFSQAPWRDPS